MAFIGKKAREKGEHIMHFVHYGRIFPRGTRKCVGSKERENTSSRKSGPPHGAAKI